MQRTPEQSGVMHKQVPSPANKIKGEREKWKNVKRLSLIRL